MDENIVNKYGTKAKTELLSIFKECLTEGYTEGQKDCSEAKVEGYYEGFQKLWDCFRNYTEMNQEDRFKAVGYINFQELFDNLTPTWFVDKIKEFEEQKKTEEEIKVGDEIEYKLFDDVVKAVVLQVVNMGDGGYKVLCENGCGQIIYKTGQPITKTGKHYDIEGLLKAMREG